MTHSPNQVPLFDGLPDSNLDRSLLQMDERGIHVFTAFQNDVVARNALGVIFFRIEGMCIFVGVGDVRQQIRSCPFLITVLCLNNEPVARCIHVFSPAVVVL